MRNVHLANSALKAMLPFQSSLRRIKRQFSPYVDNPMNSDYCITQGLQQIAVLRSTGVALSGDVLEFGSGWLPLVPLLFCLAGAKSVTATDIERLMDDRTIARAEQLLTRRSADISAVMGRPEPQIREQLSTAPQLRYIVPWDAGAHPAASVDIIVSRAVFEHVPAAALRRFLRHFHRILRPHGTMCHVIDNSDHWEHRDKSLSRVNFLRYNTELRWKIANLSKQHYQNRLRHSDYHRMFTEAGFTVLHSEGEVDQRSLEDLQTLPIAPEFRGKDPSDMATLTSLFVLRREA